MSSRSRYAIGYNGLVDRCDELGLRPARAGHHSVLRLLVFDRKQATFVLTVHQHNDIVVLVIPPFQPDGMLPPGVHWADSIEIQARFGQSPHRHQLFQGFLQAVKELKAAGCKEVFLDGSFVTAKTSPNDYDACWGTGGVDPVQLDDVFFDFTNRRARQKARFQGEFFPGDMKEGLSGKTFLEFFQVDKQTGGPKGIVGLQL